MSVRIVVPPAVEPVSLQTAKDHLRVEGSHENAMVGRYVASARAKVETFLRRSLITRSLLLRLDRLSAPIRLPYGPVQSVTEVTYLDQSGVEQTLSGSLYRLVLSGEPPRIVPAPGAVWPMTLAGPDVVSVTYVAGFGDAEDDVPADIREAILLEIGSSYAHSETKTAGVEVFEAPDAARARLWPHVAWF